MSESMWGAGETQYFYELTPDKVLDVFEEATGLRATGRTLALNSMENRVYEIEIEEDKPSRHRHERFRIAKFYRPGRWTKEQILEEHEFLAELVAEEVPVVAPLPLIGGETLKELAGTGIFFTIFLKAPGRSPQELMSDEVAMAGRLLARLHNVGARKPFKHRLSLTPETYGRSNLHYLLQTGLIPQGLVKAYEDVAEEVCEHIERLFRGVELQRVHGDCHLGNLLWGEQGPFWVDFDDAVMGPAVQDIWLLTPGRDEEAKEAERTLLRGYEMMRDFDDSTLRLKEPLRALRFIHFSSWIARRWHDPAFPRAFPHFGTDKYWQEQTYDLSEQLALINNL